MRTAALCLAGLALALGSPAAAAGGDASVLVTVNGEPVSVEGALAAAGFDVNAKSYTLCQTDGSSTQLGVSGWSVEAVLTAAGVSADQVSSVSVPRISGSGDVVLHPADYDPSAAGYRDFPEGPAVLVRRTVGADETPQDDFFRPTRSTNCAEDPNGPDYVRTPNGDVLEIDIASGTQLQVSATVDRSSVTTGQSATFTGSVANPPAGATLTYRWHFGDGTVGIGATVSHSYAAAGTYTVTLTADNGAAAGGVAAPLTEVVGSAAGAAGPGATASPSAKPRAGGTAKAGRPSEPATTSRPTVPASPTAATTPVAPAAPVPSLTAPTQSPATAGAASPSMPAGTAPAATPRATATALAPPAIEAGVPVTGRLITLLAGSRPQAAAGATPLPVPAGVTLARALGPHGTAPATSHRWVPYAAVAALLLLLGAGAVAELHASRQTGPR